MELIVISDLHLSSGYEEKTGKYSRNEDFFFDEEFKRFLEYLEQENSANNHLVIAGDFFDFLQIGRNKLEEFHKELYKDGEVKESYKKWRGTKKFKNEITKREKQYGLGTEVDKTIWKLNVIANGHKLFFEALASFLDKGNYLSIIHGNHDIELYWPEVQEALKDHVAEHIANLYKNPPMTKQQKQQIKQEKESIKQRINFYPWFYYDKQYKTYIEHGNQYDKYNSFQHFLDPRLKHMPHRLWLPFGSLFVRYFFNKLEINNPFADNIKPPTKYMRWVWKEDKIRFLKTIFLYLPIMIKVFLKGREPQFVKSVFLYLPTRIWGYIKGGILTNAENESFEEENKKKIDEFDKKWGLEPDVMKIIYSLKTPPFNGIKLLNILAFSTFTLIIISLMAAIGLFLGFYKYSTYPHRELLQISLRPFGLLIIPIIRWVYHKFVKKDFFEKNMPKIKEIKKKIGDVQTIIFGHTHDPDIRKVNDEFWYVNTGTWTIVFSEEERIIREAKQFAFVWIKNANEKPELLQWNPNLNEHQRLILFEPKQEKIVKKITKFSVQ